MTKQTRIILADDHPLIRDGLRLILETDDSISIIAEASNGKTALKLIEIHQPDIILLDIDMPEMDGFAVVRAMQEKQVTAEIIFLTMHSKAELFQAAMDLGVKGYVLKDSAGTDILKSIKTVMAGQHYLSSALTSHILQRQQQVEKVNKENQNIQSLSPTERKILRYIANDKTSKEIAEVLFISYRTVEKHRSNINKKLNLQGNLALIKFAITHKSSL